MATAPEFVPTTDRQRRHLHALLREKCDATGAGRFPVLTEMVGREITSTNELSQSETAALIDTLRRMPYHDGDLSEHGF